MNIGVIQAKSEKMTKAEVIELVKDLKKEDADRVKNHWVSVQTIRRKSKC